MRLGMKGQIGDTHFDGMTTWVCLGDAEWVDRIPAEQPPVEVWPYVTGTGTVVGW